MPYYDIVIETTELFSLFCTIFAIYATAFANYALFSLFMLLFSLFMHCFRYLEQSGSAQFSLFCNSFLTDSPTKQCKSAKPVSFQNLPKTAVKAVLWSLSITWS